MNTVKKVNSETPESPPETPHLPFFDELKKERRIVEYRTVAFSKPATKPVLIFRPFFNLNLPTRSCENRRCFKKNRRFLSGFGLIIWAAEKDREDTPAFISRSKEVFLASIIDLMQNFHGIVVFDTNGLKTINGWKIESFSDRRQPNCQLMQLVQYIFFEIYFLTTTEIGRLLGKDRSTVISSIKKVTDSIETYPIYKDFVDGFIQKLIHKNTF